MMPTAREYRRECSQDSSVRLITNHRMDVERVLPHPCLPSSEQLLSSLTPLSFHHQTELDLFLLDLLLNLLFPVLVQ